MLAGNRAKSITDITLELKIRGVEFHHKDVSSTNTPEGCHNVISQYINESNGSNTKQHHKSDVH